MGIAIHDWLLLTIGCCSSLLSASHSLLCRRAVCVLKFLNGVKPQPTRSISNVPMFHSDLLFTHCSLTVRFQKNAELRSIIGGPHYSLTIHSVRSLFTLFTHYSLFPLWQASRCRSRVIAHSLVATHCSLTIHLPSANYWLLLLSIDSLFPHYCSELERKLAHLGAESIKTAQALRFAHYYLLTTHSRFARYLLSYRP